MLGAPPFLVVTRLVKRDHVRAAGEGEAAAAEDLWKRLVRFLGEKGDLLAFALVVDREIVFGETATWIALCVLDDHVHFNQLGGNADGWCLGGGLRKRVSRPVARKSSARHRDKRR